MDYGTSSRNSPLPCLPHRLWACGQWQAFRLLNHHQVQRQQQPFLSFHLLSLHGSLWVERAWCKGRARAVQGRCKGDAGVVQAWCKRGAREAQGWCKATAAPDAERPATEGGRFTLHRWEPAGPDPDSYLLLSSLSAVIREEEEYRRNLDAREEETEIRTRRGEPDAGHRKLMQEPGQLPHKLLGLGTMCDRSSSGRARHSDGRIELLDATLTAGQAADDSRQVLQLRDQQRRLPQLVDGGVPLRDPVFLLREGGHAHAVVAPLAALAPHDPPLYAERARGVGVAVRAARGAGEVLADEPHPRRGVAEEEERRRAERARRLPPRGPPVHRAGQPAVHAVGVAVGPGAAGDRDARRQPQRPGEHDRGALPQPRPGELARRNHDSSRFELADLAQLALDGGDDAFAARAGAGVVVAGPLRRRDACQHRRHAGPPAARRRGRGRAGVERRRGRAGGGRALPAAAEQSHHTAGPPLSPGRRPRATLFASEAPSHFRKSRSHSEGTRKRLLRNSEFTFGYIRSLVFLIMRTFGGVAKEASTRRE
eukprot:gene5337-biopygen10909